MIPSNKEVQNILENARKHTEIELPYGHEINGYNYMKEQGYDKDLNKKAYIKKGL